jgi:hypothetical protein
MAKPSRRIQKVSPRKRSKPAKSVRRAAPAKPSKPPARATPAPPVPRPRTARGHRKSQIATLATARDQLSSGAPVKLGSITVPSGNLAIFDIGLMGYLPREALDPMLICAPVPSDRALPVIGTRVGKGRFADCWDHVAIVLTGRSHAGIARAVKLGKAAVDFARLIVMDRAAIDHWQHEDSLDQRADFVFWGRDEAQLAKALGARRLPSADGHGFTDLPMLEAEAMADRAAELKAAHKWLLATELRPHSHHFDALAAARASPTGAGVLEVGGARVLLFFTSWGEGVYPVYLDLDHDEQSVQIRIQLAPAESLSAATALE